MKYFPTIAVTSLILVAVLLPGSSIPDVQVVGIDKLAHFVLFALWMVAVRNDWGQRFHGLLAVLLGLLFSVSTEFLQILVEGRTFDAWDIFFDGTGLVVGWATGGWLLRWLYFFLRKS